MGKNEKSLLAVYLCWPYFCSSTLLSIHLSCHVADYVCSSLIFFLCLTLFLAPDNEDLAAIAIPLSPSSPFIPSYAATFVSISHQVCLQLGCSHSLVFPPSAFSCFCLSPIPSMLLCPRLAFSWWVLQPTIGSRSPPPPCPGNSSAPLGLEGPGRAGRWGWGRWGRSRPGAQLRSQSLPKFAPWRG